MSGAETKPANRRIEGLRAESAVKMHLARTLAPVRCSKQRDLSPASPPRRSNGKSSHPLAALIRSFRRMPSPRPHGLCGFEPITTKNTHLDGTLAPHTSKIRPSLLPRYHSHCVRRTAHMINLTTKYLAKVPLGSPGDALRSKIAQHNLQERFAILVQRLL